MSDNALSELITYLEHVNADVKRIEAEGKSLWPRADRPPSRGVWRRRPSFWPDWPKTLGSWWSGCAATMPRVWPGGLSSSP